MHKEMLEQPEAVERVLRGRLDERFGTSHLGGLNMDARDLRAVKRVKILGCGSAYYVGQMGAPLRRGAGPDPRGRRGGAASSATATRSSSRTPSTSRSASPARPSTPCSPSRRSGARAAACIGLVNVVGSAIARECDGGIYLHAGPEVAVASTKALTTMYVGLRAARPAARPGPRPVDRRRQAARRRPAAAARQTWRRCWPSRTELVEVAERLAEAESLFFVGRVRGYPVAREGAQKFKEITYRHAEAYQTSELKHGPLALIDKTVPTVAIVPDDELTDRNVGALHEIAARGGPLVVVTHAGVDLGEVEDRACASTYRRNERELDPILLTIPLQLLAYHAALHLGHDIDKPRNLAKSVTVE